MTSYFIVFCEGSGYLCLYISSSKPYFRQDIRFAYKFDSEYSSYRLLLGVLQCVGIDPKSVVLNEVKLLDGISLQQFKDVCDTNIKERALSKFGTFRM